MKYEESSDLPEIFESGNVGVGDRGVLTLENVDFIPENFEGLSVRSSTRKENLENDLESVWSVLNRKYKNQIQGEQELIHIKGFSASRSSSQSSDDIFSSSRERTFNSNILTLSSGRRKSKKESNNNISWQNGDLSTNAVQTPWSSEVKQQLELEQANNHYDFKVYEELEFKTIFPKKRKLSLNENSISASTTDHSLFHRIRKVFKKKLRFGK